MNLQTEAQYRQELATCWQIIEQDKAAIESMRQQLTTATSQRDGLNHLCEFNERTMGRLQQQLDAAQAKIDELMLEYCPNEMTPEQLAEWAKHQRAVIVPKGPK